MKNLEYEILREYRICGRVFESAWATLFLSPNTSYVEPPYCKTQACPLNPCPEALFIYHPIILNNRFWFVAPPLALLVYVLWVCGCVSRAWHKLKEGMLDHVVWKTNAFEFGKKVVRTTRIPNSDWEERVFNDEAMLEFMRKALSAVPSYGVRAVARWQRPRARRHLALRRAVQIRRRLRGQRLGV